MVNTHINRWRRWEARVRLGEVPDRMADDPALRRSEDWDQLRRALSRLPTRQRTVLVLRYFEDLPEAEIARLMGVPAGHPGRGAPTTRPSALGDSPASWPPTAAAASSGDTWLIISGRPASPSRAAETLFLKRRSRVLLYATTRPA